MNRRVVGRLMVLMAASGVLLLLVTGGCGGHRAGEVSGTDANAPDGPDILLMDDEGLVPDYKLAELSQADGKAPDIIDETPLKIGWGLHDLNPVQVRWDPHERLARRFWTKPNFIYTVELWGGNDEDDPDLTLNRQVNGKWRRSAMGWWVVDTLTFKSTQRAWMWVKIYGHHGSSSPICNAYLRIGHRDMLNLTPPEWAG